MQLRGNRVFDLQSGYIVAAGGEIEAAAAVHSTIDKEPEAFSISPIPYIS